MESKGKTFFPIIILISIAILLIFSFSNSNLLNTNLNEDNNKNNNNYTPTPFTYENARNSSIENIKFENNFGGSNDDEVCEVYNLDYYYLIGNTKSNDKYFSKNSNNIQNIFVLKMSKLGKAVNIVTSSLSYGLMYIDSYISGSGIYIVSFCNNMNSTVIILYSFETETISEVAFISNTYPINLAINGNFAAIACVTNNNKLEVYFVNLKTHNIIQTPTNIQINNILLFAWFNEGVLIFANTNDSFEVLFVTMQSYIPLFNLPDYNLKCFEVINNNFIFILTNNQTTKILLLNNNFKIINADEINRTFFNYYLIKIEKALYLVGQDESGTVNVSILSLNGDVVINVNLIHNIKYLIKALNVDNKLVLFYTNLENGLFIHIFKTPLQTEKELILPFNDSFVIIDVLQNYDNDLMIFGNFSTQNHLITANYGKSDIFIFKYYYK